MSLQKHTGVLSEKAGECEDGNNKLRITINSWPFFSLIHSLPDVWVNESERHQLKTKVVHLSKLPKDTALLLDPNIYR